MATDVPVFAPRIATLRATLPLLSLAVLVLVFASCSKDDEKNVLGPDPGPDPTVPADTAGWFVNGSIGSDDSAGTKTAPLKTIQKAIDVAHAAFGGDVFVAAGVYTTGNSLNMRSKVHVLGGYDGTTWQRKPSTYVTEVVGPTGGGSAVQFFLAESSSIDGCTIRAPDRPSGSPMGVVVGMSLGVVISNNVIIAGSGSNGPDGTMAPPLGSGGNGDSGEDAGACPSIGGSGGGGASSGGKGGDGGLAGGSSGSQGGGSNGVYGAGGPGGVFGDPIGKKGTDGRNGVDGIDGMAGDSIGVLLAGGGGFQTPDGTDGIDGTNGTGGGGGGGGYGDVIGTCGGAGGGGGGGGWGGARGTGGRGGQGSFGILVGSNCTAQILNNKITTGNGGSGGWGGEAGGGGSGEPGAGGAVYLLASKGGDGGWGGYGGHGGYGGPGGGGPSIGIGEKATASTIRSGNAVTLGTPGIGGKSSPFSPVQLVAPNGIAREFYKEK